MVYIRCLDLIQTTKQDRLLKIYFQSRCYWNIRLMRIYVIAIRAWNLNAYLTRSIPQSFLAHRRRLSVHTCRQDQFLHQMKVTSIMRSCLNSLNCFVQCRWVPEMHCSCLGSRHLWTQNFRLPWLVKKITSTNLKDAMPSSIHASAEYFADICANTRNIMQKIFLIIDTHLPVRTSQ